MPNKQNGLSRAFDSFEYGGKRIRDNVHGDILVPDKFLRIVNTSAFQRLRRIKQLATAQYVFPSADHTRFVHSLGTFSVMQRIISHFEQYFRLLGLKLIDPADKDALLAASLLHDLGHTPFSHAMEDVLPNARKIPHEKWTTDIIMGDPELSCVLEEEFGDMDDRQKGIRRIVDFINLQHNDRERVSFPAKEINMENIFRSLISSQIDADRLDYIRRDSMATGLSFGLIDVDRLIGSFRIGIRKDGSAVICIAEKFLPDIEGYLYARYQMYRNVYFKPFKILTEELLRKIVNSVYELFDHDKIPITELPPGFKAALQKPAMSIEDYLSLDDYVIMGAIKGWAKLTESRTAILATLCRCLINREGFGHYTLRDTSRASMLRFRREVLLLLAGKDRERREKVLALSDREVDAQIDALPFLVVKLEKPQLYKAGGKNDIYIIENCGRLVELSRCSGLIQAFQSGRGVPEDTAANVAAVYYNPQLLKLFLQQDELSDKLGESEKEGILERMDKLLESELARNSIEIEKKYLIPDTMGAEIEEDVVKALRESGYLVSQSVRIHQVDRYLDTENDKLNENRCTLRIRIKENTQDDSPAAGSASITCKRPVSNSSSSGKEGQMERYEYIEELKDIDLSVPGDIHCTADSRQFILGHLHDLIEPENLIETIVIDNFRVEYEVTRPKSAEDSDGLSRVEEQYELVFDTVTYLNLKNQRRHRERQIELELKSDPIARLNMQILTEQIQERFPKLTVMTDSKYMRAKRFTEN